ncbi:2-amino-4-hydroxy-6-hydroxymethyldihydropteridine diphosphokinase [Corynebacterium heidelbergense]|uniref:2-amino-4-hydroxy-6-hydroxymethyldihydropteridine diphosphokinase n=1 Tax=Corynebacterium heidelbergense TaxID=2055947 RepID=A0A364VEC0_9CORY|nr:2-amino-4-hydroxy-6-hydroxymethyldihydropteridine diphosphokinase [Corynebacterium heidelbergense]RAV34954.1 2-amino-4-hydroxy-6-hydroxymethyldihydropteridine diphosphokinase [Corynebacterium heidelbergense]WCZ35874.1 Bifunctional folate synthesis protein [Corynebacterium heidelbergense]
MGRAILGLGSNLPGDLATPADQLRRAVAALHALPGVTVCATSRHFRTPPWGGVDQAEFANAAVDVATTLPPLDLLHACQNVERAGGRVREVRWGPRTVDVDVLAFFPDATNRRVETLSQGRWGDELVLPHPYAHRRGFVLLPWADIGPEDGLRGRPVREWLAGLPPAETRAIEPVGQLGWRPCSE